MEQNRLLQLKLDSATAAHGRRDEEVQLRDWGNPNKFEVRSPMSYELPATTVEKTGEMDKAEFPSRLYREVQPQGTLTSRQHLHGETSEYNLRGSTTRADQEEKEWDREHAREGGMSQEPRMTRQELSPGFSDEEKTGMSRISRPSIVPDKFDGKNPWVDYIQHFRACKLANGWNDEEAKIFLAASLRGAAIKVMGSQRQLSRITYQELVHLLEKRFGPGQMAENYLLELRSRRQGPQETLQELGQAVRELSELAYPELPEEARDRLARTHFAEAIEEQEIREGIFRSQPTTMDEAIQAAMTTDNFFRLEDQRSGRSRFHRKLARSTEEQQSPLTEIWKELKEMKLKLEERDNKVETWKNQSRGEVRNCYNCGEKGHLARNCPQKKGQDPSGNEHEPTLQPEGRPQENKGKTGKDEQ
eukprot:XP_011661029.1 PREDICTED: uncharacterized protein LOC105436781 [Strongylocentrotus purpuratus]